MKSSLPAPTKSQAKTMRDLVGDIGCAVCLFHLGIEDSPGEIHHFVSGGKRISHDAVIPLCIHHHRMGTETHPSRHSATGKYGGKAVFELTYGTEWELLEKCESRMDRAYCTDAA